MTRAVARQPSVLSPSPLDGLLAVAAALRTSPELAPMLEAVAASIGTGVGYGLVAINVYRPSHNDFEVMCLHGSEEAAAKLVGQSMPAEVWARLVDNRFERRGCYFIPAGTFDWDADEAQFIPDLPASDDPDAWHPEDELLVPLRAAGGDVVGILSVDAPVSGRRPTDPELDLLAAIAAQAGLAIEAAQHAEAARRHRADVQHLLNVSSRLTAARSRRGVAAAVCEGIRDALGFQRVSVHVADARGAVRTIGSCGWDDDPLVDRWTVSDVRALLAEEHLREGCVLLTREHAHALTPPHLHTVYSSQYNGTGPFAWDHHWLVVPLHAQDGSLLGVIWADDPADRLLPTAERLRTLRAFANQAASAIEAAATRDRLAFLAEHDPLTGLRNRRNLHETIDAALRDGGALLVVDADAFKRVNDELGHATGDEVLRLIADEIHAALPEAGIGARLGGEEFAVVLPGHGAADARLVGEAIRGAVHAQAPVPWGLTLSGGLAVADGAPGGAGALLRAATRALSAAKRLGRDRIVAYDAATIDRLLPALESAAAQHLSAVLMLAETLDLRDAGTARHSQTVGRYAEAAGRALGLPEERVERLRIAGVLHDIGKIGVADAILHKPGRLTREEWAEIERHPEVGGRILSHAGLGELASWVLAHHERWDGAGYPQALAGEAIPLEARVLAVADAYEAMTASRPYRPAPMRPEDAVEELRRCAGTQFDPAVVDAFIASLA